MPLFLSPIDAKVPLPTRLEHVGRVYRSIIFFRNGSKILVLLTLFILLEFLFDWLFVLPSLIRAVWLCLSLVFGVLSYYYIFLIPFRRTKDPLYLSFLVERHFPMLNDSLNSAIQFSDITENSKNGSIQFREYTIQKVMQTSTETHWDEAIDRKEVKRWLLALTLSIGIISFFGLYSPKNFPVACFRFTLPFQDIQWPKQTNLIVLSPDPFPTQIARGDNLDVKLAIRDKIPDRLTLIIQFKENPPTVETYAIPPLNSNETEKIIEFQLDSRKIRKSFSIQFVANDAQSPIYQVNVVSPPYLVPLDGRPSPQIHLEYPEYTDLAPFDLSDGTSMIEAIQGSKVTLQAAVNRPITSAKLQLELDSNKLPLCAAMAIWSSQSSIDFLAKYNLIQNAMNPINAQIAEDGLRFGFTFIPAISGNYRLVFADDAGVKGSRLLVMNLSDDPSPIVIIERPSANIDSLYLKQNGSFLLRVSCNDRIFALKDISLHYQLNKNQSASDPVSQDNTLLHFNEKSEGWQKLVLQTNHNRELLLNTCSLFSQNTYFCTSTLYHNQSIIKLRPRDWVFEKAFKIDQFKHRDGTPLRSGERLTIKIAVNDFDNVNIFKKPGFSQEIDIHIVTEADLDTLIQSGSARIRNDIFKLQQMQLEAQNKLKEIQNLEKKQLTKKSETQSLTTQQRDELLQLAQMQQGIRNRLISPGDGLIPEIEKQLKLLQNSPSSGKYIDRFERIENELKRLLTSEIEPLEGMIESARKEPIKTAESLMQEIEKKQSKFVNSLQAILELLEPWSSTSELRGEARSLLGDLQNQIEKIQQSMTPKKGLNSNNPDSSSLPKPQKLIDEQKKINENIRALVEKIQRVANERESAVKELNKQITDQDHEKNQHKKNNPKSEPDPILNPQQILQNQQLEQRIKAFKQEAEILKKAIRQKETDHSLSLIAGGWVETIQSLNQGIDAEEIKQKLNSTLEQLQQNNLPKAQQNQSQVAESLKNLIEELSDNPIKIPPSQKLQKILNQEDQLGKIIQKQEELKRDIEQLNKTDDPQKKQSLQKKVQEQQKEIEQLTKNLREQAQLLNQIPLNETLQRAERAMAEMQEQLTREKQDLKENQEKILDQLDLAQEQLEKQEDDQKDQLSREQRTKLKEQLQVFRDRQATYLQELERMQKSIFTKKQWSRAMATSFSSLKNQQQSLHDELKDWTEQSLASEIVLTQMLNFSMQAMSLAQSAIQQHQIEIIDQLDGLTNFDEKIEEKALKRIHNRQSLALKRLEDLLEALKPDDKKSEESVRDNPKTRPSRPMDKSMDKSSGQASSPPSDLIPAKAQIKALKSLQEDLLARTEKIRKERSQNATLDEDEKEELELLHKSQQEVANLIRELIPIFSDNENTTPHSKKDP